MKNAWKYIITAIYTAVIIGVCLYGQITVTALNVFGFVCMGIAIFLFCVCLADIRNASFMPPCFLLFLGLAAVASLTGVEIAGRALHFSFLWPICFLGGSIGCILIRLTGSKVGRTYIYVNALLGLLLPVGLYFLVG